MAFGTAHTVVQLPHAVAVVLRSVSHPLPRLPSQLPWPAAQRRPQSPSTHCAVASGPAEHRRPHAPQSSTLVPRATSQPSLASRLQSPKPEAHADDEQDDAMQSGVARARSQAWPHAPQFSASLELLAQRPSQQS
jgi:hypothetical protein